MPQFKEIVLTKEAHESWLASPKVAARSAQIQAFAQHQGLRFDAEGMTRVLQFNIALNQTQGPMPDAMEFM